MKVKRLETISAKVPEESIVVVQDQSGTPKPYVVKKAYIVPDLPVGLTNNSVFDNKADFNKKLKDDLSKAELRLLWETSQCVLLIEIQ